MGADAFTYLVGASTWAGYSLNEPQLTQLGRYHQWLQDEAIGAGGIGPHELDRLWTRHIADSLLFGIAVQDAHICLDIGSGVGLPGIPLAVSFPDTEFYLIDRSGRRCDLMRRAIAVLGLENCRVEQQDVRNVGDKYRAIVSRAAIPPDRMMIHVKQLLEPGGIAVLGLSWGDSSPETPSSETNLAVSVMTVPADILDTDVKLLRIEAT